MSVLQAPCGLMGATDLTQLAPLPRSRLVAVTLCVTSWGLLDQGAGASVNGNLHIKNNLCLKSLFCSRDDVRKKGSKYCTEEKNGGENCTGVFYNHLPSCQRCMAIIVQH